MSAGATLYVVRATLYSLSQTLKGEEADQFWKLIDEVYHTRPKVPIPEAIELCPSPLLPLGVEPSTHFPPALMDHLFSAPPILCLVCGRTRDQHLAGAPR